MMFRNISKYTAYRQEYWLHLLAICFLAKCFIKVLATLQHKIILENWHCNLIVVCKEWGLILFLT
jgi:hypothetical protein